MRNDARQWRFETRRDCRRTRDQWNERQLGGKRVNWTLVYSDLLIPGDRDLSEKQSRARAL